MSADLLFVGGLFLFFVIIMFLGFRYLPGERWQVMACVPLNKEESGLWKGMNLTYYGFFNSLAYIVSLLVIFILLGSVGIPFFMVFILALIILGICVPSASIVARLVEGKRFTFSVGGASFVGIVTAPWVILLADRIAGEYMGVSLPVFPVLAALSIGYALGEGTGRLACISYGCCYGKPLDECGSLVKLIFKNWNFVFTGKTKKIAYASQLDGVEVIPVQGVTSTLFTFTGLAGVCFFLNGNFFTAFLMPLIITQIWRFVSEFLRADYRGGHAISPYQILSLIALFYAASLIFFFPSSGNVSIDIMQGLQSLWNPAVILTLEAMAVIIFLHTGRSGITYSSLTLQVNEERI